MIKSFRYVWGVVLIAMATISLVAWLEDYKAAPYFNALNIATLLAWGIYYLFFSKKKDAVLQDRVLVVTKGAKQLQKFDLSTLVRAVHGHKSIKLIFQDKTETLMFRDFEKQGIDTLKSLA